jgi:hypothetical protein
MQERDIVSLQLADEAGPATEEHLGWSTFGPPPPVGLVFGAVYGAIAGLFIAYDVTVLIRIGRIVRARMRELDAERNAAA